MQNRWNDAEADHFVRSAGANEADQLLALRVYSSRLIGSDPDLVLHGGGNTSVKVERNGQNVLHVKGSGWDLETIEAPGLPAVALAPLLEARHGGRLSDPAMVAFLRANLLEPSAPTPSVETLLHAFVPARFVDHSHAIAVLALANQPDAAAIGERLYSGRVAVVPYVMPGFDLSIESARVREQHPDSIGLWLVNHGLFTWGDTAEVSYQRMIELVSVAEEELARAGAAIPDEVSGPQTSNTGGPFAERLAEVLSRHDAFRDGVTLDLRDDENVRAYVDRPDIVSLASRGTLTPDHVIRTKPFPLIVKPEDGRESLEAALVEFIARYTAYFDRNVRQATEPKTMLDPLPRVVLVPGLGLFGIGRKEKEARIVADLAAQTARVVPAAERYGRYQPLSEDRLFEMEYWSLEQAKLSAA